MDQIKTGKFIAEMRKEKGYTQKELSEILGISDKTMSKWETGRGFPDISLLMPLCDALDVNVNELLSGERLSDYEYKSKAEEYISELVKERQSRNMKPVKNLYKCLLCVTLFVAVLEMFIAIICNFFHKAAFEAMAMNSLVWVGLCIIVTLKYLYDKFKLKNLKQNGLCFEAEVIDVLPAAWIRVANYSACKLECRFFHDAKEYMVKSSYCLLTPFSQKEDFRAIVYCDKNNLNKYSVEIMR